MKRLKLLATTLALMIAFGAALTGCGNPGSEPEGPGGPEGPGTNPDSDMTFAQAQSMGGFVGEYSTVDGITYGKGMFVAVGNFNDETPDENNYYHDAHTAWSADGINWTAGSVKGDTGLKSVTYGDYGGGRFVAVGATVSDQGTYEYCDGIYYSDDGKNWDIPYLDFNLWILSMGGYGIPNFSDIAYGAGKYVAIGYSSPDIGFWHRPFMVYSADGVSWTHVPLEVPPTNSDAYLSRIHWNGQRFIVTGRTAPVAESNYCFMLSSTDGISWEVVYNSQDETNSAFWGVGYGADTWVVGGETWGDTYTSPSGDAETWTKHDGGYLSDKHLFSATITDITYAADRFVGISDDGEIGYSADGMSWTKTVPFGEEQWLSNIAYGAGRFVVVGTGHSTDNAIIWYSNEQEQ
jgi:hypothetical protein